MRSLSSALALLALVALAAWVPSSAAARSQNSETGPAAADSAIGKQIQVVRVQGGTPEIDGSLDDAAWRSARWVSDFTQKEPDQGQPATLPTEVAFLFDEHALYVGARMHAQDRSQIGDLMTRRDDVGNTERLIVSLDTYHDRRTAYSFAVTAAGVRVDYFHTLDTDEFHARDFTFDPVWTARTRVGDDGWTAEMRIPFSQLRFNAGEEQVWGVNVNRYVPALNEDDFWIVVPRDQTGWASRFGDLVGIRGIAPSRRVEVTPYVASSATLTSDALIDSDDPFREELEMGGRTGADFQMGLGPNLTLDAAINPDFGQVEADPAEVNLTAFETFFDERRPFFTKGQENFGGVGPAYYYSRRIGAPPHGRSGGDFDDAPQTTTIWGAAKLTGRLPSGLTVGALAAVTDDEHARAFDLETGASDKVKVEPYTGYGVMRLQQQIGENASILGLTLTGVQRSLESGSALAARLPERAITGGVDWNKRFTDGWYEILGHLGFSHVSGEPAAIEQLQRSSAHFFQRPDADHVELDPDRESLTGWSAALRGGKRTGNWRWNHGIWMDSPGFEINDAGRLSRADDIQGWIDLGYRETNPGPIFRNWLLVGFSSNNWNFDGVRRRSNLGLFSEYTLLNFVRGFFETGIQLRSTSDDATRGGPLMETPRGWWVAGGAFNNFSSPTRWGLRSFGGRSELGGWEYRIDPELTLQASDRLTLSFQPRYKRSRDSRQFLTALDAGPAATFGRRYVFGWVDRSEIAMPVRASYAFSPELSLELYAEPFAASGRFFDIGELERARDNDLVTYGEEGGTTLVRDEQGDYAVTAGADTFTIQNPDFDALSFRSNLVMRWEWRPGSTFFVVWQQNRAADEKIGRLVNPDDLLDSFAADGENILAVKFSYWLPL
ncbi:MAG TPA: DUF5916 domain-containing protein [Gemmatimonadota bacterium]|nr:DUF5916 domain-containing protein [Gemmatimonadota bacterium]